MGFMACEILRFFDSVTGDFGIGDVGQDKFEESTVSPLTKPAQILAGTL